MKLSDMKTSGQVLAEELRDPAFRREWDRTAVARALRAGSGRRLVWEGSHEGG